MCVPGVGDVASVLGLVSAISLDFGLRVVQSIALGYPFAVNAAQSVAFKALIPVIRRLCPSLCLY